MLAHHRGTTGKPMKTAIVTAGSRGIGAGVVNAFLERGYNVVANSRHITKPRAFEASDRLALVDGNIADPATLHRLHDRRSVVSRFGQRRRVLLPQPACDRADVGSEDRALVYLTEAGQVTGEVLHVDGGAHVGKW